MRQRGRPRHPDILTPREWDVLVLLQAGLSNEGIARRLGITTSGAKYHVSSILGKLGFGRRQDLSAWMPPGAQRRGVRSPAVGSPRPTQEEEPLDLHAGIATSCDPEGCLVRLLGSGATVRARYSPLVLNRIKIRPDQLVAIDTASTPTVVYRWFLGRVEAVERESIAVRRCNAAGEPTCPDRLDRLPAPAGLAIVPGDRVFYTPGDGGRLWDKAQKGVPANLARIRRAFPQIEALYAS